VISLTNLSRTVRIGFVAALVTTTSACSNSIAGTHESEGAALAEQKGCVACHGADGRAIAPAFPNLSNQWARYLNLQLRAYRSGKRENSIMNAQAAQLSDEEIQALANHYGLRP
jgi:cytochrome c553